MTTMLRYFTVWLFIVTVSFLSSVSHALHVVIVSTSYDSRERLTSLQHTKIGLDYALQEHLTSYTTQSPTRLLFNLTYELVYLTKPKATGCPDMEAGIDDVVKFYYSRTWNEDKLMTLITPGCGDSLILGSLAREWNVLMLTTGSMYPETRNRERYPTLVSISPIQAAVGAEALFFMLHNYNWTDMTIIFDAAGVAGNNDLITILREQASRQNPKLWLTLLSTTSGDAGDLLRRARSVSRVIFLSMHPTMVRKYMLIASDLSMTNGDFVYFVPQMARAFVNGNLTWQNFDDSDQVAFAAFQSVIQLAPCTSVDLESSFVDSYFRDMANISQRDYAIPFLKGDNLV